MGRLRLTIVAPICLFFLLATAFVATTRAATAPSLGTTVSYAVLANSFLYANSGTGLVGNLGYATTSGTGLFPSVSGSTHIGDSSYSQAGTDQATVLASLASQSCTANLAFNVDLATYNSGIYAPGVYCVAGPATIGAGGITLSGSGTYVFRISGTLVTADHSVVRLSGGATTCDVFWTTELGVVVSTLGSYSTFVGTMVQSDYLMMKDHATWTGRGLLYGGTLSVDEKDTIAVPSECPIPASTATLRVVKVFYNDYGGTAVAADATIHVKNGMGDVSGSPSAGADAPGTPYVLSAGSYVVSEDAFAGYMPIFSGDCASDGSVTLAAGDDKTCTVSNDEEPPDLGSARLNVVKVVVNDDGGTFGVNEAILHVMDGAGDVAGSPQNGASAPGTSYTLLPAAYSVSEDTFVGYAASFSGDCDSKGNVILSDGDDKTCTVTNDDIAAPESGTGILYVIKHVVNDDGGSAKAEGFSLHLKGSGSFGLSDVAGSPADGSESGTPYVVPVGTYYVSEDSYAGYSSGFSGDCDDNGVVTIASGETKTCTITNDDTTKSSEPPATLRVVKVVVNDNGGTAVVSDAILHVQDGMGDVAGSPQAGADAPGTAYSLTPGSYTVSEDFFEGYSVKIEGDCDAGGDVDLVSGDDKTCTVTNDDIDGFIETKKPEEPPPETTEDPCDVCGLLTYDLYIINPDLSERHTGTAWVRVTNRGNNVLRYSFEDKTLDPNDPLYDYNDSIIDVDFNDCRDVKFLFVSSDASWKHQVRIRVEINGVRQSDTLVADDSRAAVGTMKAIDATKDVDIELACSEVPPMNLLGRILLQVEQHGEAWYVHPRTGLRYYMKDGPTAYDMMRNMSLGITDVDLTAIRSVETVVEMQAANGECLAGSLGNSLKGWIMLQVQQHGEAWYVDPTKCLRIYLEDGAAAYTAMRYLSLGISDADLAKITVGD